MMANSIILTITYLGLLGNLVQPLAISVCGNKYHKQCPTTSGCKSNVVWYIGECMVSLININYGIKEPTHGYHNCNPNRIFIFGEYFKVRKSWKPKLLFWSIQSLTKLILQRFYQGIKVLTRGIDLNGIRNKNTLKQTYTLLASRKVKSSLKVHKWYQKKRWSQSNTDIVYENDKWNRTIRGESIPVDMQPLVVSPKAWIWNPCFPGFNPLTSPSTVVEPVNITNRRNKDKWPQVPHCSTYQTP